MVIVIDASFSTVMEADCNALHQSAHRVASREKESGARCISDGRSLFNIEAELKRLGGTLEVVEAGSLWVRQAMVRHQGTYGMESSAHHYFGSLKGFDSGLLSFLHLVSAIEHSGEHRAGERDVLEDGQCLAEATIENLSIDQATHQLDARFGRYRVSRPVSIRRSCSARGIIGA